jgi:glycosyltransferase involved in cell wall biosynthesis
MLLDEIIFLNEITKKKFNLKNINGKILYNYLENSEIVNNKIFDKNNIKILYCNRISNDKNSIMLFAVFKEIINIYPNIVLTFLAGGSKNSPIEYNIIKYYIDYFNITPKNLIFLDEITDTKNYYLENDFCILCSVSEGCSYNLLESINYEIPIIHTNNIPNNEVINEKMPSITLEDLIEYNETNFCITNYNEYLKLIGYVFNSEMCVNCKKIINKIIFIPEINKNYCNICNEIINKRHSKFFINVNHFKKSIIEMIENFNKYKNNIINLKKEKYYHYSEKSYYLNIFNILFNENIFI